MQSIFNCPLASRQLPEKEKKKPVISKNAYRPALTLGLMPGS